MPNVIFAQTPAQEASSVFVPFAPLCGDFRTAPKFTLQFGYSLNAGLCEIHIASF